VKLILTKEYPAAPPKGVFHACLHEQIWCCTSLIGCSGAGYFLTKIFHPNVSTAGDICVNTLKKDWTSETTLAHVLAVIRCLLIVPFPESSLNDDAGKLFMDSYDEYSRKAKLMTSIHAMEGKTTAPVACGAGDDSAAVASTTASAGAGEATEGSTDTITMTSGSEPIKVTKGSNITAVDPSVAAKPKAVTAPDAAAAKKKASMKRL
jgi:ubiquitin-conjugating enzyme E2 S